ncbi:MAG: hypothetical protein RLY45_662 [Actinomycetota bacterium]
MLVAIAAPAIASCSAVSGEASEYNFACDAAPPVQLSLVDISTSGRDIDILAERLNAVQVDAERVADCDGEITIVAWGGSASTSEVLFQGQIRVVGASEIGRDRKIPAAVDAVMDEVRQSLATVLGSRASGGHDLLAAFSIVSDFVRAAGGTDANIAVSIYADGVSTEGSADINRPGLSEARLEELIAEQTMPDLSGVPISMFGVGRLGGTDKPPQQVVDLTQAYAQMLCEATGAECRTFSSTFSAD